MEFVWIGVLNYLRTPLCVTAEPDSGLLIEETLDWTVVSRKARELSPDIVLSNYTSVVEPGPYLVDAMPMMQPVGFQSGIRILERWADLLHAQREGGWVNDRELFRKYYA